MFSAIISSNILAAGWCGRPVVVGEMVCIAWCATWSEEVGSRWSSLSESASCPFGSRLAALCAQGMPWCVNCLLPEPGLGRLALRALSAVPHWLLAFSERGSSVCAHHRTLLVPQPCQAGNLMCAHISAPLSLHRASLSAGPVPYVTSSLCEDRATPCVYIAAFCLFCIICEQDSPMCECGSARYFRTFSEKGRSVCGYHSSLLTPPSLQEGNHVCTCGLWAAHSSALLYQLGQSLYCRAPCSGAMGPSSSCQI